MVGHRGTGPVGVLLAVVFVVAVVWAGRAVGAPAGRIYLIAVPLAVMTAVMAAAVLVVVRFWRL